MRPAMRFAKKKLVRTPGGNYNWHRLGKKHVTVCGVCRKPLLGTGRTRAHNNFCSPCSRRMLRAKVSEYVKEG